MEASYTTGQAARLSGVDLRTIAYWDTSAFIVPSVRQASGKGTERLYGFRDIVALRAAGKLRRAGISLQALRKVVRFLQEYNGLDHPLSETYLVSDSVDVFELNGEQVLSLLRRPGQAAFAWIIDLRGVVNEVQQLLAA